MDEILDEGPPRFSKCVRVGCFESKHGMSWSSW